MRPGMGIELCVARLKRLHYAFKRLHEIWIARLTAEPVYELKMAFSLHAYYAAEHVATAAAALARAGVQSRMMVDCSHDNSGKSHLKQPHVVEEILEPV